MIGTIFSVIGVLILLVVGVSIYVGWQLTHPKRKPVDESPANYGMQWIDVTFPSRRGDVKLDGWWLLPSYAPASKTQPCSIIMSHGYAGTRLEKGLPALALAKGLVEAGHSVMMFDFRNSGRSEGHTTTIGFLEKDDILGAIDCVRKRADAPSKVMLIGFSMGGTASILAAAEETAVSGVITDSAFSQLYPYLKANLPVWSKLPRIPFTPLILLILPKLVGVNLDAVDALAATDLLVSRPVLFIHSRDDLAIPFSNSVQMFERNPQVFELWLTTQAGHVGSFHLQSEDYTTRVLNFIAKC